VEAVFRIYVYPALSNDYAVGRLYQGASELGNVTFSTAQINAFTGQANAGYLTWDLSGVTPPGGSWTWDDFALLTLHLEPEKNGGADPSTLYIDAIGFRVITSGSCPAVDPSDIMTTVPLTDTYNTTYLQFVSADPPQTAVNTTTGVITWTNVGPIYPGETRVVTVRFLAKAISGTSSQTVNNSAGSTGTRFADGGYANNVYDTASGTICQTGSINGYVYSDPNSSGWNYNPGGGDLPIPGVQVTLYGCYDKTSGDLITTPANGNKPCTDAQNNGEWRVVSTQATDASGYYAFNGLLNGFYYVQVNSGNLPGTVSQTAEANDNQSVTGTLPDTTAQGHTCPTCDSTWGNPAADLKTANFNPIDSAGETINGVNFGYHINPGVYGLVWEDNNGDGDRDDGEGPISGVTVHIYANSDCSGASLASTTTDANGRYQFGNLTAGSTYCIAVDTSTLPGGTSAWTQTGESDGSINNRITFNAVAGTLSGSHDFGFRKTGSYTLGDTVYYDWDGDGAQDSNEEGIRNVTVSLYEDSNGNGLMDTDDAFIASTTTNGSGFYQFASLVAGNYLVIVDTNDTDFPAGVTETQDPDESGVCTACNSRGLATLGPSDDTVDFGYQPRGVGAIGDTVYRDMNGDGTQAGPTETGIANITVWLEVDLNNDGTYARVATTVTDADGKYLFENLPDGKYRVVVDDTDADLPEDVYGHTYELTTPSPTSQITISNGSTYLDADFGFAPGAVIGDRIWRDDDGDGNQDIGEPGIAGVTVGLYTWTDTNNNGYYDAGDTISSTPLATDVTDSDGLYLFSGLEAGNYVVKVDSGIPSGYSQSGDPDWLTPCTGSGLCDGASGVNLRTGQIDLSRDFGYVPPGVIGDTLWIDSDGDGSRDADESGIPYITVWLYAWTDDGDGVVEDGELGALLATTETDSDGYYAFGGLSTANVSYAVVVDASDTDFPTGLSNTYDPDGTLDGRAGTTLTAGSPKDLTRDFGYRYAGDYNISGTVFFDAGSTGDGTSDIYDSGTDTPYANVTVYLWNSSGQLVGTTTTDASGYYEFTDLPNGTYVVSTDPKSPQLAGLDVTAAGAFEVANYHTVSISGNSQANVDFGYYAAIDYGDLPNSYRTTIASEGPGHILGNLRLGANISSEANGQPKADAAGDTYDDGIGFTSEPWMPGVTVGLTADVVGSNGYLVGWFDWNNDGTLSVDEMIVFGNVANGSNDLSISIPSDANTSGGHVFMRFRLYDKTTLTGVSPTGLARNGEVEDYRHRFYPTAITLSSITARSAPAAIAIGAAALLGLLALGALFVARRRKA